MRRRAVLLAPVALAACGFAPVYGPGGDGLRLRGRVVIEAPQTEDGTRLRRALEDRLGPSAGPLRLAVTPEIATESAAVTRSGAITRYTLAGRTLWRLSEGDRLLAEGETGGTASYSATGSTVAVDAAARDARERLMQTMADAVLRRLLLLDLA
ncbi:Lipopolysaccharide-assembly [Rubellimicrobium thermophilum DSM 16684]|uniref:Lipopolysaccharide-assembly n=1 Tax=Rubellimicrobium thermophilum DSM 16684 TaxID=1123069 RepID=S9QSV6_9RHOB|nr:LPS assembly lipoprotein LptE [Rubellimicrobium thermophilum]EPX82677.1 Lipopolysaccharide-assembly [Rubellimicrobium thermophilum DSM 16684]